jgi:cytochrome c oxidase cbb3-type subunit 3
VNTSLNQMRVAVLAACLALAACGKQETPLRPTVPDPAPAPAPTGSAPNAKEKMPVPPMTPNTPQAVASGQTLFVKMNCAGCHTYTGKGFMGPDLTDTYWRYGGQPDDIYRSIYEGRPQGMPAWGKALQSDEIWQLVHYIRSLPIHPGGDPNTMSPATHTGQAVDSMPPEQGHEAAK